MTIETMPNELPGVPMWIENTLPLPQCCPVSGNPQRGSRLRLRYRPAGRVLEVYSLQRYIEGYVGGHESGVRNMEAMIQQVASDCAAALGVQVVAIAELVLHPCQEMTVRVVVKPPG